MLRLADLPRGSWATRWASALDPAKVTYTDYRDADFNCQRTPLWDRQNTGQLSREYTASTPGPATAIEHVEIAVDTPSAIRDFAVLKSWMDDCQPWYPNGTAPGNPRSEAEPMRLGPVSGQDPGLFYANVPGADRNRSPDASVVGIGRVGRAVVALWMVRNDSERTSVDTVPVKAALVAALDRLSATVTSK